MYMSKSYGSFLMVIALVLGTTFSLEAHEKKWPEKRLRQIWTEAEKFTSKQISLTPPQISQLNAEGIKINAEERSPTFYFAQGKDPSTNKVKVIGIIIFIDGYGANGRMEISVAMGDDGKIKKIDLWEHSENILVSKEDFLKQFIGKNSKDSFVENKDYQIVKEAPLASKAVAHSAILALKLTNIVFERK